MQSARVGGLEVQRHPRHEVDERAGTFVHEDTLVFLDDGREVGRRTDRYTFRIRSADAILAAHEAAGLQVQRVRSWVDPTPGGDGPRVLLVCRPR